MSTHNRAEIVDERFIRLVREQRFPTSRVVVEPASAGLTDADVVDVFESQIMSRQLDLAARWLKVRGDSFYTIGSAGHEGNAAIARAFRVNDMAFLHYRSCGFFVQRAKMHPGSTPLYDVMLSLVASSDDPISEGRHKVFGSVPLWIPPQTSTIASHVPKAVGAALSIRRMFDLQLRSELPNDAVILCSFGDASLNHASALSGINTAIWCAYQKIPMPIVFVCEDNGIGISVPTPQGWVAATMSARPGIKYFSCDGRNLVDVYRAAREAQQYTRRFRKPAFLHMETVRLLGHAGSDMEALYRSKREIEAAEEDDPLLHSARYVIERGLMTTDEVVGMYQDVHHRLVAIADEVVARPKLRTCAEVQRSIVPPKAQKSPPPLPAAAAREAAFGSDWRFLDRGQHMAKHLNWALHDLLLQYPQALVFGEDVARKGGVYYVTAGLQGKFGSRRVFNSPLDETSILGTAIGLAHNGLLPIPEIQFLAYVHNAEDQLRGEAATLSFFSSGKYTNPMVVRIAGLAYQKGFGGHFHNDNSLAVFRDLPGVIVGCPASPADAARMLRSAVKAAHEDGRVVVMVEPIALYMTKDLYEPGDGLFLEAYPDPAETIPIGQFGVYGTSKKLAIVTYGNGTYLSRQAAKDLEPYMGEQPKIIDLRWLTSIDEQALGKELAGVEAVLVVDECRRSGNISEGLMAALVEQLSPLPRVARVTAEDCFIPLGVASTVSLPSRESIGEAAKNLLQLNSTAVKVKRRAAVRAKA